MKSISDQLSGMERLKAPNYLLNRVNKAVTSPSWYSKLFDFIPGSGGFKAPMEFATMAAAAILVLLIFFNINIEKNENAIIAESGRHETSLNKESGGPVHLDFFPAGRIISGSPSSENVISVDSGQSSDNSGKPGTTWDTFLLNLTKMVDLAEGDIASREYGRNSRHISAITVKIPLSRYDSFIRMAENIGRFEPPAPSLTHQPADPVLLRIRLNESE